MGTIILTGGGSGGHIIPNIALLPYLKNILTISIMWAKKIVWKKKLLKNTIYLFFQ